jgi:hypothetical protein
MSYFAAALSCLVAGLILTASGFGYPSTAIEDPESLAVIHLITIGWLGFLFAGSLLQFVPVLVSRPLETPCLSLPVLLLMMGGLGFLLAGFLGLADILPMWSLALPLGGSVLTLAFAGLLWMVRRTLAAARPLPLPAKFVALGCAALVGVAVSGLLLALPLSGLTTNPYLVDFLLEAAPSHAYLGLVGWMTVTAIGVSYRLLAMFLLSPERSRMTSRAVGWLMASGLGIVACGILPAGSGISSTATIYLATAVGGVAALIYGLDVHFIFRERKRKSAEMNVLASLAAVAMLIASFVLFEASALSDLPIDLARPAAYLFVFGWLTGLGLGQLYKIVAFMTWLECYGPVLGRAPVPRVQELVNERRSSAWFLLYFGATAAATIALIAAAPTVFRWMTLAQLAAICALVFEFAQARRLAIVPQEVRLPNGARHPQLFLPSFKGRSQ